MNAEEPVAFVLEEEDGGTLVEAIGLEGVAEMFGQLADFDGVNLDELFVGPGLPGVVEGLQLSHMLAEVIGELVKASEAKVATLLETTVCLHHVQILWGLAV